MAAKKKVSKKVTKKVSNKKVARKATKKVVKKAPAKKATAKKATTKKATAKKATAKKATAKKATKKAAKKVSKKATRKTSAQKRVDQLQGLLKENLSDLSSERAEEVAKSIWLAGLGAYSRTFDEVSERVDDLQDKVKKKNAYGQKAFDQLVKHGVTVQKTLEKAMKQGKDSLEERVAEFKKRFGGGLSSFVDIPGRLRDAAEKIEELSEKLQKK